MPGFTDVNIFQNYTGSGTVHNGIGGEPSGYSFKIPMTLLKDSEGTYWPSSEIVVQLYNSVTETYINVPSNEWQIYSDTIYVQSSQVTLPSGASNISITIYRVPEVSQEYTGEAWNTLTPEGIAAGLDKVMRVSQRALFESVRSLKVHPQDTNAYDEFTGQNIPGQLTIPQGGSFRANKALGFDPTGTQIVAIGDSITASATVENVPDNAVLRGSDGHIETGHHDFTPETAPTFKEGRQWYDSDDKVMKYFDNISGSSVDVGQEERVPVYNDTGSQINDGQVVYISGGYPVGKRTKISLARADVPATSDSCIGVATHNIANGADGVICTFGVVRDVNTNSWNDGDPLYLSTVTAGLLTNVRPTSGMIVRVGFVSYKHASQGRILVSVQHQGTADNVTNTVMSRDSSGRSKVSTPNSSDDIANKAYVDNAGGAVASFIVGSTIDNDTTFGKLFSDGAVTVPVSGYGSAIDAPGTTGSLVATFNGSSALAGTRDLKLAKVAGASIQGRGWSVDFQVAPAYLGVPWQIQFPYYMDAPTLDNKWQVFVFATAEIGGAVVGSVIPLSDQYLHPTTAPTPNQFFATFFPTTSLYYRLILMYTASDTTACNVNIDNITVSKQTSINAAAVGATGTYVSTITGGGAASPSTATLVWERVGDRIIISGMWNQTVSGSGASTVNFSLPSGLTAGVNGGTGTVKGRNTGTVYILENAYTASSFYGVNGASALVGTDWVANAQGWYFQFSCQIAQWTTNINLATDFTEYASNNSGIVSGSNDASYYDGIDGSAIASMTAFTSLGIKFKRPIQPSDQLDIEVSPDGIKWFQLPAYFNGVAVIDTFSQQNTTTGGIALDKNTGSQNAFVRFGQYSFLSGATFGAAGSLWSFLSGYRWRVRKVSNGNMAEQPPVVRAVYSTLASALAGANMIYGSKIEDTNSIYNPATGVITFPIPGVYRVKNTYQCPATAGYIRLQGTFTESSGSIVGRYTSTAIIAFDSEEFSVRVKAGDTAYLRQDSALSGPNTNARITIERIGS